MVRGEPMHFDEEADGVLHNSFHRGDAFRGGLTELGVEGNFSNSPGESFLSSSKESRYAMRSWSLSSSVSDRGGTCESCKDGTKRVGEPPSVRIEARVRPIFVMSRSSGDGEGGLRRSSNVRLF